jgi:hypothetical protein
MSKKEKPELPFSKIGELAATNKQKLSLHSKLQRGLGGILAVATMSMGANAVDGIQNTNKATAITGLENQITIVDKQYESDVKTANVIANVTHKNNPNLVNLKLGYVDEITPTSVLKAQEDTAKSKEIQQSIKQIKDYKSKVDISSSKLRNLYAKLNIEQNKNSILSQINIETRNLIDSITAIMVALGISGMSLATVKQLQLLKQNNDLKEILNDTYALLINAKKQELNVYELVGRDYLNTVQTVTAQYNQISSDLEFITSEYRTALEKFDSI